MTTGYVNKTSRRFPASPKRKLTDDQAQYVRESKDSGVALSRAFGVSEVTIHNVRHFYCYKPNPPPSRDRRGD